MEYEDEARLVDLDGLSPVEVVALGRFLRAKEDEHNQAVRDGQADDFEQRYAPYVEAVNEGLAQLPERNPAHARDVYTAFVDSPHEGDRDSATRMIDYLVQADQEHGLVLWDRLMRDPSSAVRRSAFEQLGNCGLAGGTREQVEEACRQLGVTGYDVVRLLDAYVRAEQGADIANPYEMGELVLRRLVPPSPEPSEG